MPRLAYLNLEKTSITSGCAPFLRKLTALKVLDLRRCLVGDAIGDAVTAMLSLEALMLAFTEVTDSLAATLAQLHHLRCLKLTGVARFTDDGIQRLSQSPSLQTSLVSFDVGSPDVTNGCAGAICLLRSIESLQLWETSVNPRGAGAIAAGLGLEIDDQIRCTSGTHIFLSRDRLQGVF